MEKYQYVIEDSHTWVKPSATEQKVKVVTGEVVEIDETYQNQARLFVAGFRKVKDDGTLDSTKSNDAVIAENANLPVNTDILETDAQAEVEVEFKDDGKDEITIKVEKPSKKKK